MKRSKSNIAGYLLIILAVSVYSGCSKEAPKNDYVARVNNEYLTSEELNNIIDTATTRKFYKNEIIRNWINQQLIYQKAIKDGIIEEKEFRELLGKAQKELAVTLYLQKILNEEKFAVDNSSIESFYNEHLNEFKLFYDAYVTNSIQFKNEDNAVKFRNILLESSWDKALNAFNNDSTIVNKNSLNLNYDFELQPPALARLVKELNPNEVSIVFSDDTGNYSVVQLVKKFNAGEIPPVEFIKDRVEKRILAQMRDDFLKNYINELYSNNDIEVKN